MPKAPDSAEVVVLRKFVARFMSLQKELSENYHSDENLRDRFLTAVYIPTIQRILRDRTPPTIQQAVNRIANQLSDKAHTAGTSSAMIIQEEETQTFPDNC